MSAPVATPRLHDGARPHGVSRVLLAIAVALAAGSIYLPSIRGVPFHTKGEPREAVVVQQMVERGELVSPLLHRGEIPSKPPLFHWLGAGASVVAGGVTETTVRIPSLVASVLIIAATIAAGYSRYGTGAGLAAGVVLATSQQWIQSSTAARVDMVLTLGVCWALFGFSAAYDRRRPSLSPAFYASCALAVLAKGPIGYLLPLLVIGSAWLVGRDPALPRLLRFRAATLLLLVPLLWYVPAWIEGGQPFLDKLFWKENVYRVLDAEGAHTGHVEPFYYYGPAFLGGLAPWSLLLPALAADLWRRRKRLRAEPDWFLLVWIAATIGFYSLAGSKRAVYLLPAYPPAALLLGAWIDRHAASSAARAGVSRSVVARISGMCAGAALTTIALVVAAQAVGLPLARLLEPWMNPKDADNLAVVARSLESHRVLVLAWATASLAAAAVVARSLARARTWPAFGAVATVIALTVATAGSVVLRDMAAAGSIRAFMQRVRRLVPAGEQLSFDPDVQYVEYLRPAAVYYADRPIGVGSSSREDSGANRVWILAGEGADPSPCSSGPGDEDVGSSYECTVVLRHAFADSHAREPLVLVKASRQTGRDRDE